MTEAPCLAERVPACGGKSDATPLWNPAIVADGPTLWAMRKRRRRYALPAQSKTWRCLVAVSVLALLSTLDPQLSTAFAQGTAFTYQGRLGDNGAPASGIYDLRFTIYDLAAGRICTEPTAVVNIVVNTGIYTETARITQPTRLTAVGGSVRIGPP
jgi:hypothetical protein